MGRAKLALVPINKLRQKSTTFQKRKAGLFKKASEFSTLCGVDACVIVYGPQQPAEAETWPSDLAEVRRILRRSAGTCRGKHVHDLSDFFQTRKKKIEREIAKQRAKNWRAQYLPWDSRLDGLSEAQLRQFLAVLDAKLERAKEMTHFSGQNNNNKYYNGNNFYNTDYMKAVQYLPRHDQDVNIDPRSSSMLMLVGGYDNCDSSVNGNGFQYYASEMGVYNNNGGVDGFRYDAPLHGGDSYQYGMSSSYGSNLQSYTALLGGGGGGGGGDDGVSSINGNLFGYYTMIGGGGGGGDVGSSDGNEESKSLVYYDSGSNEYIVK